MLSLDIDNILPSASESFSTVIIKFENTLPSLSHDEIPKVISRSNETLRMDINRNILILLVLESLLQLDFLTSELQKRTDSRTFLLTENIPVSMVFEKCYHLDLPNVYVISNGSYYAYCFSIEINIFEVEKADLITLNWFDNYRAKRCRWTLEVASQGTLFMGGYFDLFSSFGEHYEAHLQMLFPPHTSDDITISKRGKMLNHSLYQVSRFLEYVSIVIIVPTQADSTLKYLVFIAPFEMNTWIVIALSVVYLGAILCIVSHVRGCSSVSLLPALEIVLGKSVKLYYSDTIYRITLLGMILYGLAVTTIYSTFLGSFMIKSSSSQAHQIVCNSNRRAFYENTSEKVLKWRILEDGDFGEDVYKLDPHYGYCLSSKQWEAFYNFQMHLGSVSKRFQILDETLKNIPIKLRVRNNFCGLFDKFVLDVYSAGLFRYWYEKFTTKNYIHQAVVGAQNLTIESGEFKFQDLKFTWIMYLFGCLISVITFAIELGCNWL